MNVIGYVKSHRWSHSTAVILSGITLCIPFVRETEQGKRTNQPWLSHTIRRYRLRAYFRSTSCFSFLPHLCEASCSNCRNGISGKHCEKKILLSWESGIQNSLHISKFCWIMPPTPVGGGCRQITRLPTASADRLFVASLNEARKTATSPFQPLNSDGRRGTSLLSRTSRKEHKIRTKYKSTTNKHSSASHGGGPLGDGGEEWSRSVSLTFLIGATFSVSLVESPTSCVARCEWWGLFAESGSSL